LIIFGKVIPCTFGCYAGGFPCSLPTQPSTLSGTENKYRPKFPLQIGILLYFTLSASISVHVFLVNLCQPVCLIFSYTCCRR